MWGAMGEAPRGRVTRAGARCWSFEGGDGRGRGGRPRAAMNMALCWGRRHQLVVVGFFDGGRRYGRGLPSPPVWLSGDRGGRSRGGWLCPFTRSGRARRTFPRAHAASAAAAAAVAGAAAAGRGPLDGTGATMNEGDSTAVGEARVWPRQRLVLSHRHPPAGYAHRALATPGGAHGHPPPSLFSQRPAPAAAGVVLLASSRGGGRAPRPLAPAPAFFFLPPPSCRSRARAHVAARPASAAESAAPPTAHPPPTPLPTKSASATTNQPMGRPSGGRVHVGTGPPGPVWGTTGRRTRSEHVCMCKAIVS